MIASQGDQSLAALHFGRELLEVLVSQSQTVAIAQNEGVVITFLQRISERDRPVFPQTAGEPLKIQIDIR